MIIAILWHLLISAIVTPSFLFFFWDFFRDSNEEFNEISLAFLHVNLGIKKNS